MIALPVAERTKSDVHNRTQFFHRPCERSIENRSSASARPDPRMTTVAFVEGDRGRSGGAQRLMLIWVSLRYLTGTPIRDAGRNFQSRAAAMTILS